MFKDNWVNGWGGVNDFLNNVKQIAELDGEGIPYAESLQCDGQVFKHL